MSKEEKRRELLTGTGIEPGDEPVLVIHVYQKFNEESGEELFPAFLEIQPRNEEDTLADPKPWMLLAVFKAHEVVEQAQTALKARLLARYIAEDQERRVAVNQVQRAIAARALAETGEKAN